MTSRRQFIHLLSLFPFFKMTGKVNKVEVSNLPRCATSEDYNFIDKALGNYFSQQYGMNLYFRNIEYVREQVQLYSTCYKKSNYHFTLSGNALQSDFKLNWKEIDAIIKQTAQQRECTLYFANYSFETYSWLDNYIKEHLEEKFQIPVEAGLARSFRESAQINHYVYSGMRNPEVVYTFTLHTVESPKHFYVSSLEVLSWIQKWEKKMNPFWMFANYNFGNLKI